MTERVVVISSSPLSCAVVRRCVRFKPWEVVPFLQPLPALQALWQQCDTPPLALLLDLNAPWDSYALTYQIRTSAPSLLRSVPILGLSHKASLLDRLRAHVVGIDAILLKPFAPQALLDLLATWQTNPPRKR